MAMTRDAGAYERKFEKVMEEFEAGSLKSSSGDPVTSKKQAQAIAHSEATAAASDSADGGMKYRHEEGR